VLEDAAKETNFVLSTDEEEDWDIWWIDCTILPTLIHKMKWYQRTNHLPAVENLARKNCLAKHLNAM
jgi:tubulin polyglutamylase TTLL6/13